MTSLVGKKLGKLLFVAEEKPPEDEPRRFKYAGLWYRVSCDCGTEKLIPRQGCALMRSCGCSQYDRLKTVAPETTKYFPDQTKMTHIKTQIYTDL